MKVAACSVVVAACLAIVPSVALGEGTSALGGSGGAASESPLVVEGAQALVEGQGVREAEEVRLDSPEAVAAREASQTAFEGLGGVEAARLAGDVFPGEVDESAGGLSGLPVGVSVSGFVGADAAQLDL